MATIFTFNGKRVSLPGVYAQIKSAVQNPPIEQSFGNVLIIDKDEDNAFGWGAGIQGELAEGPNAIYEFSDIEQFRSSVRGGEQWDLAKGLFRPFGAGSPGVSKLHYAKAMTTTAAELNLAFNTAGNVTIKPKAEGLAGNGLLGDGVRASALVEVTAIGAAGDTIDFTVDGATIATYTVLATDTIASVAQGLLAAMTGGYTATRNSGVLTVQAPVGSGTAANAFVTAITVTGANTGTASAFTGGTDGTTLTQGYGVTFESGVVDTTKFIIKLWRGTFTGLASDGISYDETSVENSSAELVAQTPEISTLVEFQSWMERDFAFNAYFVNGGITVLGTGAFAALDLVSFPSMQLFAGGTQVYDTARMTEVLDAATDLDYTFILVMDSGANAYSADNVKIQNHLLTGARFQKYMVVAGGDDANGFLTESFANAALFNSSRVIMVHGGVEVFSRAQGSGTRVKSALYKAAHVLGRIAGLQPQTPVTFKGLDYLKETHILKQSEKEAALEAGVLTTTYDTDIQSFVVCAGINTLQGNSNDFVVNSDGTSHLISVERIAAQLNKELEVNMKITLLGNQSEGPNRATLNDEVVKVFVKNYLREKEVESTADNLILSSGGIVVSTEQDAKSVTYEFTPNFEVNKIFVTGFMVDPNV